MTDYCNHHNIDAGRNEALRTTSIVCIDCGSTIRSITDLELAQGKQSKLKRLTAMLKTWLPGRRTA